MRKQYRTAAAHGFIRAAWPRADPYLAWPGHGSAGRLGPGDLQTAPRSKVVEHRGDARGSSGSDRGADVFDLAIALRAAGQDRRGGLRSKPQHQQFQAVGLHLLPELREFIRGGIPSLDIAGDGLRGAGHAIRAKLLCIAKTLLGRRTDAETDLHASLPSQLLSWADLSPLTMPTYRLRNDRSGYSTTMISQVCSAGRRAMPS